MAPYAPIILAVILILAGLLMCRFCDAARGVLAKVVYWVGVLLLIVGLLILLFPVLAWLYKTLLDVLGIPRGWDRGL